jgi:hypothetical protein
MDIAPFHWSLTGILTGDVADPDRLGHDGNPYPRMDWRTSVDDYLLLPDGRGRVTPLHTFTAWLAPGVEFTPSGWAMAVGLNDPADFHHDKQNPTDPRE